MIGLPLLAAAAKIFYYVSLFMSLIAYLDYAHLFSLSASQRMVPLKN